MKFEKCNDVEVKKTKKWCGPADAMWFTKFVPQFFPCACKWHDIQYGQKHSLRSASKINYIFLLRMIYSTNQTKRAIVRPLYYFYALLFYCLVMLSLPYYIYFKWRRLEE